jgi:hypothetical protein
MSRSTRLVIALVAVVSAAVLVPLSQAMTVITDNSPSQNTSGQSAYVHSPGANGAAYEQALGVTTDPYSQAIGVFESKEHPAATQSVRFTTENAPSQNRISLANAAQAGTLTSNSNPFDWADAGIGAGVVGGVVLLLGAGMLLAVRRSDTRRLAL